MTTRASCLLTLDATVVFHVKLFVFESDDKQSTTHHMFIENQPHPNCEQGKGKSLSLSSSVFVCFNEEAVTARQSKHLTTNFQKVSKRETNDTN